MPCGDAVHPRAMIAIDEDPAGCPVRDAQTAQGARVFESNEGAFRFAHFRNPWQSLLG
eukprot:CAMPEP_0194397254 /NCGR_PEP_ID=MMETSP0174-20130528/125445_1 /TAXON_ID=216777 /ORGANISM="Proboscia alata, Strain PI-D3" /LENGTH=57 /DNA_ID=CAMNT_0039193421 /DNA_START=1694 /DNA_END=1867 /DNA_ORIENTATION=-